jgi:hypothetical protein
VTGLFVVAPLPTLMAGGRVSVEEILLAARYQWRKQIIEARNQHPLLTLRNHLARFVE